MDYVSTRRSTLCITTLCVGLLSRRHDTYSTALCVRCRVHGAHRLGSNPKRSYSSCAAQSHRALLSMSGNPVHGAMRRVGRAEAEKRSLRMGSGNRGQRASVLRDRIISDLRGHLQRGYLKRAVPREQPRHLGGLKRISSVPQRTLEETGMRQAVETTPHDAPVVFRSTQYCTAVQHTFGTAVRDSIV